MPSGRRKKKKESAELRALDIIRKCRDADLFVDRNEEKSTSSFSSIDESKARCRKSFNGRKTTLEVNPSEEENRTALSLSLSLRCFLRTLKSMVSHRMMNYSYANLLFCLFVTSNSIKDTVRLLLTCLPGFYF